MEFSGEPPDFGSGSGSPRAGAARAGAHRWQSASLPDRATGTAVLQEVVDESAGFGLVVALVTCGEDQVDGHVGAADGLRAEGLVRVRGITSNPLKGFPTTVGAEASAPTVVFSAV